MNMNVTIIPVGMLGTNCYLLSSEKKNCVIFDPGAQPDKIAGIIEKDGLTPKYILLTHGHHDHIGGVQKLLARFGDCKVYIGEGDKEMLEDTGKSLAISRNETAAEFLIPEAATLKDGQELTLDELTIKVLDTPGHTKGGVSYICGNLLFSGDTLFYGDVGRTDLYGGSYSVLKKSLKKLHDLPGDYCVYPGHGDATTLEYERKNNRYIGESL